MYHNLLERQQGSCSAGTSFYVCQANGFSGCCSVDACNLPTCPDAPASSSPSVSATTTITLTPQADTQMPTPLSTASPSTSPIPTSNASQTSQAASLSHAAASPTNLATPASMSTVQLAATSTSTPIPVPTGSSSKTPVIAGVVVGVVGAAIISILIWFFLRRRKQKKLMANSTPMFGTDGKEKFAMDTPDSASTQEPAGDVFAPFGGYHRTSSEAERQRQDTRSLEIENPSEDAPLSNLEKSELVPPPAHEHPVYHPLPDQSPQISTYQNQHPAFTPSVPLRPAFPSYSPVHLHSTPITPQNEMEAFPSPIISRTELPTFVPRPLFSSSNLAHHTPLLPQQRPDLVRNKWSMTASGRSTGTSSSTYSIPIGLGVEGASKQMDGPSGLSFSRGLEVNLRHNLSTRENNEREHVMSWATYGGPEMTNSKTEVSPIMEQRWSGSSMTPLSPMSSDGCAAR